MKQLLGYADILIEAPCYLGYLWMADKFCKKYLDTTKKKEWLFVILSFVGWLLLNIVGRQYPVPYILSVMLNHILFMGLTVLLFRAERMKKILAASMLMVAMTLVGNFFGSFLSCMALSFRHTVNHIPEPVLNDLESGVINGFSFCVVIVTVYWMSKHLTSVFCGKSGKWYIILAIPMLVIIAVFDVAGWGASNGVMVRSGGIMGVYYDQIFSHMEFCVLALLLLFAIGFYVFGMERICLEQKKSSQYHSQIAVYKMLEEQYRQSERLRHDMKNHIIAMSGLFQSKEWEKLGNYLKSMEGSGLEMDGDITGNKAVDALLHQKRKWAEREHVNWECDVQIPKVCSIHEFDLCVLFGNILDNALEACARLQCSECRFVTVQAKIVKKCFLLEVKNSMDRTEQNAGEDTKKENMQEHGIGLLNVSDVVHRYHGIMNIEIQNGIFVISILIPLSDAGHDIKRVI